MTYIIEGKNVNKWKQFCITEDKLLKENLNRAKEMYWQIRYREFPNSTKRWRYLKGDLYSSIM